jgi:hypothetical protein
MAPSFDGGSGRRSSWVVVGIWAVTLTLTAISVVMLALNFNTEAGVRWGPRGFFGVFAVAFSTVGALICLRRSDNLIGWLLLGVGLGSSLQFLTAEYAVYGVLTSPVELPLSMVVAWVSNWLWIPVAVPFILLLPILFPQARLPSPRWRFLVGLSGAAMLVLMLTEMVRPGPMENFTRRANPFAVESTAGLAGTVYGASFGVFFLVAFVSMVRLVYRLRDAHGKERQQLKWFTYAALLLVLVGLPGGWTFGWGGLADVVGPWLLIICILGLVAAVGIAILRYQLFDIDLIIRRTVTYSLVLAALVVAYLLSVILLQRVFALTTGSGQNELVTVLSTLAIAALFVPVRNRVQETFDRRFYRSKYDAQQVLTRFAETVRDETNLDNLIDSLVQVVNETMRPKSLSLWLRKGQRGK